MDQLAELQEQIRHCRLCYEAGHDIVPGGVFSGTAGARVLLIGQAPGVTEVEVKRPFNGGSGRRLFQWLGEAGWNEDEFRAAHYMSAVTKCYPGKHPNGKGDRVPSRAEQKLCRPYMEREIRLVRPWLMILVGKLSIQLLYPAKAKLTEIIGTAVYFPPEALTNPVNFDMDQGQLMTKFDPAHEAYSGGRYVVPLPHPSGASLWPNRPENKILIKRAIEILHDIRVAWKL